MIDRGATFRQGRPASELDWFRPLLADQVWLARCDRLVAVHARCLTWIFTLDARWTCSQRSDEVCSARSSRGRLLGAFAIAEPTAGFVPEVFDDGGAGSA